MKEKSIKKINLYKYNKRGEIESVYYPYGESLEIMAKKEALEARLYPSYAEFEWYNYSNEEQEQIKEALGRMKIQFKYSQGQRVWSEHYTYDNNSNLETKKDFANKNTTYEYQHEQIDDFVEFLERNNVKPGDVIFGYIKEYYEL